jgi:hypothetical protein
MPQAKQDVETADPHWRWLYRIGGAAALFAAAMIPIQLIVFIKWGQPETALGWFMLFEDSKLAGLLAFELLLVISTALGIATTLALYVALTAVLIRVDPAANSQRGRRSWPHLPP